MFVLDKRHEVRIVVDRYNENTLSLVSFLIRVFQDVKDVTVLDVEQDFLERDVTLSTQLFVLFRIPVEALHVAIVSQCVLNGITPEGRLTSKL